MGSQTRNAVPVKIVLHDAGEMLRPKLLYVPGSGYCNEELARRAVPDADISKSDSIRMRSNQSRFVQALPPLGKGANLIPARRGPFGPVTLKLDISFVVHWSTGGLGVRVGLGLGLEQGARARTMTKRPVSSSDSTPYIRAVTKFR